MFYQNMPKGVAQLNLIQVFSTVGFAVLLGTLNLYLQKVGMPIEEVNTLTASFFALNFLLHFLGGVLGGRWISFRGLFCFSLVLQIAGLIGIAIPHIAVILLGMGLFVTGAGLNVSCINMMLTQLFTANDMRRRTAFSLNYAAMNIGFLFSFIVANQFQAHNNYMGAFIFAAICVGLALLLHAIAWRHVADKNTHFAHTMHKQPIRFFAAPSAITICLVVLLYLMHHPELASILIYVAFGIGFIVVLYSASQQTVSTRHAMFIFIILIAATMMYAFIQGLTGTALQNFVKYNTNQAFLGLHIEPSGFNLFESLFVIIFGLLLARWLKYRRDHHRLPLAAQTLISRGLAINVLSFLMLPLGVWYMHVTSDSKVLLFFPILQSLFVAMAEVGVNVVSYSLAGEFVPTKWQGLFTGYMFLNIAFGTNLAGPFSNAILGRYHNLATVSSTTTNPMYVKMFLFMALVALVVTIIYLILNRVITKWRAQHATEHF